MTTKLGSKKIVRGKRSSGDGVFDVKRQKWCELWHRLCTWTGWKPDFISYIQNPLSEQRDPLAIVRSV